MHAFTTLLFASLPLLVYTQSTGTTTRYWDCCKASCSWPGKSSAVNQPVNTCDANNSTSPPLPRSFLTNTSSPDVLTDFNSASGCTGGSAYMCANQTPIVIDSNTAYGYAAVALSAGTESDWCCACYELTFTSGPVAGKKMVVQATNTGGGLSDGNHFDIAIPGGGVGQFNACTKQCKLLSGREEE